MDEEKNEEILMLASLFEFVKDKAKTQQQKIRRISTDLKTQNSQQAENLLSIFNEEDFVIENYFISSFQSAIELCGTSLSSMKKYLLNYCLICKENYPRENRVPFDCGCVFCNSCFDEWFKHTVSGREVISWICPGCKLDPQKDGITRAMLTDQLGSLHSVVQFRSSLEETIKNKFYKKMSIYVATENDRFVWCAHGCDYGYIVEADYVGMAAKCPSCNKQTCIHCRRKWTESHRGKSCEQFIIETDNDIATLMRDHGVFCPECKTPCEVAPGGCLHTHCVFCATEYCTGCRALFYSKTKPCKNPDHKEHGLHAHHPRNCAESLRNFNLDELKQMLASKDENYKKKWTQSVKMGSFNEARCGVNMALKIANTTVERRCNKDIVDCGMCSDHLTLYLIRLINKHKIDPLPFTKGKQLKIYMEHNYFEKMTVPPRNKGESKDVYHNRLRKIIADKLPLPNLIIWN